MIINVKIIWIRKPGKSTSINSFLQFKLEKNS